MREIWVWFLSWEDPLEKGTATHASILAWRIPWTIVHGVAESHDWATCTSLHLRLTGLISSLSKGLSGVFSSTTVWRHQFFGSLPSKVEDLGLIPGLGRSPGEGNSYPLQHSGLENPMSFTVHKESHTWTTFTFTFQCLDLASSWAITYEGFIYHVFSPFTCSLWDKCDPYFTKEEKKEQRKYFPKIRKPAWAELGFECRFGAEVLPATL